MLKTLTLVLTFVLLGGVAMTGSAELAPNHATQGPDHLAPFRHPKNLQVLPKDISPEALHETMHVYSKSLGVNCSFCHVEKPSATPGGHPEMDFASDANPHKLIARKMIKMTADINGEYLAKIETGMEVTCVSCHRGNKSPMVSVDSLPHAEPHMQMMHDKMK